MIDAIDENAVAPDQFLKDSSGNVTTEINLAILSWKNLEELNTLLNVEERAIKKRSGFVDANTMAMAMNFQSQGFGRGRGRNNNQRGHGGRGFNFNGGNGFNGGRGFNGSNGFTGGNVSQFGQSSQARLLGFSGQSSQNGGFQG
nr:hypothetical protein CFP56_48342 [Quercus suber]